MPTLLLNYKGINCRLHSLIFSGVFPGPTVYYNLFLYIFSFPVKTNQRKSLCNQNAYDFQFDQMQRTLLEGISELNFIILIHSDLVTPHGFGDLAQIMAWCTWNVVLALSVMFSDIHLRTISRDKSLITKLSLKTVKEIIYLPTGLWMKHIHAISYCVWGIHPQF